jgi:SAM-dependent methyltransferase
MSDAPPPGKDDIYAGARRGPLTRVAEPLAAQARERRHALYRRVMAPRPDDRILDVGCGPVGLAGFEPDADITGLDSYFRPDYPGRQFVPGDATELPFADTEFAIAYSNSLVEHLDPADRARFASEIRRVASRYWVQTPNRRFPVEPHTLLPCFQFLPRALRRRLWRFGVAGGEFEDIRLLDAAELRRLFPDAVILRERVAGLTKSLIATGPAQRLPDGLG